MQDYSSTPPPLTNKGPRPRPLAARFWSKVDRSDPDGCWPWKGGRNRHGYGRLGVGSTVDGSMGHELAHRVSWTLHYGPIPDGFSVCHRCDNPPCVRPTHLFLGTQADNMQDCAAKRRNGAQTRPERMSRGDTHGSRTHPERLLRGDHHPGAKVTADIVRDMRALVAGGTTIRALSRRYGVSRKAVSQIVKRRTWQHVE